MPTISLVRKAALLIAMLAGGCAHAEAGPQTTDSVDISGGRTVAVRARHLVIKMSERNPVEPIRLPGALRRAMASASSIVFPESTSLVVDGREYILVIVNQLSSANPMGYCGAGEEGEVYALQIAGAKAETRFSALVQSCLKNIDLASDGVLPPARSVSWNPVPAGIRIAWMSDARGEEATHIYQYERGEFVEGPGEK